MRALDFIATKRQGQAHSKQDLEAFIMGYVRGEIPDYQVAAWLMAVLLNGMTPEETADLTNVMADSGERLELAGLSHVVDKHSTGGVGDKTSLVLAPLLASCGATVAKMSGRGLGHTGGTVDKLESIPGFRSVIDEGAFLAQARELGLVITGQSKNLAPADGLLYALRDATATVPSLPLIASSIMSKKLAGGAKSIVLDVKVGSGAFMTTLEDARALAAAMVDIGKRAGRKMRAVISSMEEPLGRAVGNALEVQEAIGCLRGEGPEDLTELCLVLAEEVLSASGLELTKDEIRSRLQDGRALETFRAWVAAQGGDVSRLDALEVAPDTFDLSAATGGWLARLDALSVGRAVAALGGGRKHKQDPIDLGVGAILHKKLGDRVEAGEAILTLYHRGGLKEALKELKGAVQVEEREVKAPALILAKLA